MNARIRMAAILLVLAGTAVAGQQTPTFTRTQLQDQELSAANRHGVMSRSEFEPGATSGRHFHPGEELGYLLEGTLELTIDGQKPKVVKAGDAIFVPAGAIHNATNIGKTPAKVLATYVLEKGKPLATVVK